MEIEIKNDTGIPTSGNLIQKRLAPTAHATRMHAFDHHGKKTMA